MCGSRKLGWRNYALNILSHVVDASGIVLFPTNRQLHGRQHGRVVLVHVAEIGLWIIQIDHRHLHRFLAERSQLNCDGHELLCVPEIAEALVVDATVPHLHREVREAFVVPTFHTRSADQLHAISLHLNDLEELLHPVILLFPVLTHVQETMNDLADTANCNSGLLHQHLQCGAETLLLGSGVREVLLLHQMVQVNEEGGCEDVCVAPLLDAWHQCVAVQSHEADGFQLREVGACFADGGGAGLGALRFHLCQDISTGVDKGEARWEGE